MIIFSYNPNLPSLCPIIISFFFKNITLDIAIIGGNGSGPWAKNDLEVISISHNDHESSIINDYPLTRSLSENDSKKWNWKKTTMKKNNPNDSISLINTIIPPLPSESYGSFGCALQGMRGSRLPNNDLLVSGGFKMCGNSMFHKVRQDTYLVYNNSTNQWKEVGKMKMARCAHSSVLLNGCLYSSGGVVSSVEITSHHEVLNLDGRIEEKKELPIALSCHTANKLNEYQYMVIGGSDKDVSKKFQIIKKKIFYKLKRIVKKCL